MGDGRGGRRTAGAVALALVLVAAALLGARLLLSPGGGPEVGVGPPAPRPAPPESRAPTAPSVEAARPAGEAPPPAETPAKPPAAKPAGWIEVRFVDAEGAPPGEGADITVYALPAGAAGTDDDDAVPHARWFPDEKTLIPVALPGRYDVGCVAERVALIRRDVEVAAGATARVEFRLPPAEPAVFRFPGEAPSGRRRVTQVWFRSAEGAPARAFPGREESFGADFTVPWSDAAQPLSVPLPRGREFRFELQEEFQVEEDGAPPGDAAAGPERAPVPGRGTVRAGDTVEFALVPEARLSLRFRTDPAVPAGCALVLGLRLEQAGAGFDYAVRFRADRSRERSLFPVETTGIPGAAVLRWRGVAAAPGDRRSVGFPEGALEGLVLSADAPVEREIPLRIDPGPALLAQARELPVRVEARLADGSAAPPAEVQVYLLEIRTAEAPVGGWGCRRDFPAQGPVELPADVRRTFGDAFVTRGPWAAGGLEPLPEGVTLRTELRPTGLLRPEWDAAPGEDWGRTTVRRADGDWLPSSWFLPNGKWELVWFDREVALVPGVLLGPLPEGAHAFEVRLGGARLADATGVVKAGTIEPLRLRITPHAAPAEAGTPGTVSPR